MPELPSEMATNVVIARGKSRGNPRPIFETTSLLWEAWLHIDGTDEISRPPGPEDVPVMMALHKLARQLHSRTPEADNIVDVCGFMNTLAMMDWSDDEQPSERKVKKNG